MNRYEIETDITFQQKIGRFDVSFHEFIDEGDYSDSYCFSDLGTLTPKRSSSYTNLSQATLPSRKSKVAIDFIPRSRPLSETEGMDIPQENIIRPKVDSDLIEKDSNDDMAIESQNLQSLINTERSQSISTSTPTTNETPNYYPPQISPILPSYMQQPIAFHIQQLQQQQQQQQSDSDVSSNTTSPPTVPDLIYPDITSSDIQQQQQQQSQISLQSPPVNINVITSTPPVYINSPVTIGVSPKNIELLIPPEIQQQQQQQQQQQFLSPTNSNTNNDSNISMEPLVNKTPILNNKAYETNNNEPSQLLLQQQQQNYYINQQNQFQQQQQQQQQQQHNENDNLATVISSENQLLNPPPLTIALEQQQQQQQLYQNDYISNETIQTPILEEIPIPLSSLSTPLLNPQQQQPQFQPPPPPPQYLPSPSAISPTTISSQQQQQQQQQVEEEQPHLQHFHHYSDILNERYNGDLTPTNQSTYNSREGIENSPDGKVFELGAPCGAYISYIFYIIYRIPLNSTFCGTLLNAILQLEDVIDHMITSIGVDNTNLKSINLHILYSIIAKSQLIDEIKTMKEENDILSQSIANLQSRTDDISNINNGNN